MTELREIVAIDDRFKFDELVYRRDTDRGQDPREHDYRHSRVSMQCKNFILYQLNILKTVREIKS